MKSKLTELLRNPKKLRSFSLSVISLITLLAILSIYWVTQLKTHYSISQFYPEKHPLLTEDLEVKKRFDIIDSSPHIVLLSLPQESDENWTTKKNLRALTAFTNAIEKAKHVDRVISLANVESAIIEGDSFSVGRLLDIATSDKDNDWVFKEPLITPNLISHDGKESAVIVTPEEVSVNEHQALIERAKALAKEHTPMASVMVGGPAAMRTQITHLLGSETVGFLLLSLLVSILIQLCVFKGWSAIRLSLLILFSSNMFALSFMALMDIAFTVLSTTVPILITITATAITVHTLVHLGESLSNDDEQTFETKLKALHLFRPLILPHSLTAITTAVGFSTLLISDVPLLREYGISVAGGVLLAASSALLLLPNLLLYFDIPKTRPWLRERQNFAHFVFNKAPVIVPVMLTLFVVAAFTGKNLSWTAKLFDDLPSNHETKMATDQISKNLGGVIPFDVSIGSPSASWKDPANIAKLDTMVAEWRKHPIVGNVVSVPDFVKAASADKALAKSSQELAETYFVYGMSGNSPLTPFMSGSESYVRLNFRLIDAPSNQMKAFALDVKEKLERAFPAMQVQRSGFGAIIHPINDIISKELLWGFFQALIFILILLTFVFRSLRWALVSALPNLFPPVILLGALALAEVPITPMVATIFAISLGIAFDNTVYILGRLRELLKESTDTQLPIVDLLKKETNPCLVTSISLMAGFSLFLFSYFTMNQTFGLFMMLSIASGLLGDLLFLPATLRLAPWLLPEKKSHAKIV